MMIVVNNVRHRPIVLRRSTIRQLWAMTAALEWCPKSIQEAQLLLGDRATRKHAKDS